MIQAEKERTYLLELTEEQYDIIAMCTEVVHRISVGQVEELNQIVCKSIDRELLGKVKEQAFPELLFNSSYKWCGGHPNKSFSHFQAATYAIYREMLHFRVVHEGRGSVYQSPTLRCEGIDIPKITLNDNTIRQEKQEDEK